jgi:hypothetical protein
LASIKFASARAIGTGTVDIHKAAYKASNKYRSLLTPLPSLARQGLYKVNEMQRWQVLSSEAISSATAWKLVFEAIAFSFTLIGGRHKVYHDDNNEWLTRTNNDDQSAIAKLTRPGSS